MGIRLDDVGGFEDLMEHNNHTITVVTYGRPDNLQSKIVNVALECLDCNEVLLDFNRPKLMVQVPRWWSFLFPWMESYDIEG